jgi:hypothetical protein
MPPIVGNGAVVFVDFVVCDLATVGVGAGVAAGPNARFAIKLETSVFTH